MPNNNPRSSLGIVFVSSIAVYAIIAILLTPFIFPVISQRDDLVIAVFQVAFGYIVLFLIFLLPTSYVYWQHRIDVKVIGPEPAAAEPGDEITLTVAIGIPQNASLKGAVLEAFLGSLNVAAEKVETSPTQLTLRIPEIAPGYHKITVQVSQEGYFSGTSVYELLIAPADSE